MGDNSKVIISIILALLILPQISLSFAAPVSWDGGGDGVDWFDPNNWDSDTLPLDSDDVIIDGNANVDLSSQFLITSGSLIIKEGSTLFMTEESPIVMLDVGGLLTNDGTVVISNEVDVTGMMINNGDIIIQSEFDSASPHIFIVDEQGVLVNNGNILLTDGGSIDNFNFLNNLGNITIEADGIYQNRFNTTNGAIFTVKQDGTLHNAFNFTNNGSIIVEGRLTGEGNQDVLTNNDKIENKPSGFFGIPSDSLFQNNGNFTNSGDVFLAIATNDGLIFNLGTFETANLISNNDNFTNSGTIDLSGEIINANNGFFRNGGQITLGKDFGGEGTAEGIITNDFIFENNDLITVAIGSIANADRLTNNGVITNEDQINNAGNGRIKNVGTINNNGGIDNAGNGKITNVGTINNNDVIDNQNIINNCGTIIGNAPLGGTVNDFCPATIIIVKDTVPDSSTDFGFTSTTLTPTIFSLDDDTQGPLQNTRTFEDLAPGLYNVTETFSSSYITTPNCDDGSSIMSISAQDDETITCTFTNLLDSDLDGLASQIDTNSLSFSNDFDDEPLGNGGSTNGTVTDRKSLTVWITDELNPSGVKIRALNGPSQNATISVCNGASTISFNDGDEIIATCGSVDLTTITGSPLILFNSQEGIRSSVILPQGNGIFFEPITFKFSVPGENPNSLPIEIEAAAKIIVEFPQNEQNAFTFEPETVTFTSDASNEGDLAIIIGDKEETISPNSSISPLIAIDQSITIDKNQQIEIALTSLGGDDSETVFEIVTSPSGQLVQNEENSAIISYTPNVDFVGVDQFEFRAIKGSEQSNTGVITINVVEKLVKQKISGKYVGKFNDLTFTASGIFKIGKENFKKVNVSGAYSIERNAKCFNVLGSGVMDFKKGDTLNVEFNAKTCSKTKILSKLEGTVNFVSGTGIFDGAQGSGEFSQVNVRNNLIGELNGHVFIKKP